MYFGPIEIILLVLFCFGLGSYYSAILGDEDGKERK